MFIPFSIGALVVEIH